MSTRGFPAASLRQTREIMRGYVELGDVPGDCHADGARPRMALEDSVWRSARVFPNGVAGLVSTADDYFAFASMLLDGGSHGNRRPARMFASISGRAPTRRSTIESGKGGTSVDSNPRRSQS